jgi:hypothetical protein
LSGKAGCGFLAIEGQNREHIDAGITADFGRRDYHPHWRDEWEAPHSR